MTKKQAIEILTQVCSIYRGTLSEHKTLQEALEVISKLEEKNDGESPTRTA